MSIACEILSHPLHRAMLPLLDPPQQSIVPPAVVLPPRPEAFPCDDPFKGVDTPSPISGWHASTHIHPAAWPRSRLRSVQPIVKDAHFEPSHLQFGKTRDKAKFADETEQLFKLQEQDGWVDVKNPDSFKDQQVLWIAVNRYTRNQPIQRKSEPGLTLLFAHATGLHKETWEPLIAHVLSTSSSELVDEFWTIDCLNQGDSSLLNRSSLGETFSWPDHGRDIANLILHYLPPLDNKNVPYILKRQSPSNLQTPWRGRKIVGCGHSLGGAGVTYAASLIPSVFYGMAYFDPILPLYSQRNRNKRPITMGAVARRDVWPSFEEAYASFKAKSNFFGRWTDASLQRYVYTALYKEEHGEGKQSVYLKARKQNEALVFADPKKDSGEQGAGYRLSLLPHSLTQKTLFVHPELNRSVFPEEGLTEMVQAAQGSRQVRIEDAGHLLVQENPSQAAFVLARFLFKISQVSELRDGDVSTRSLL